MEIDWVSGFVYETQKLYDEMKIGFVCDAVEQQLVFPDRLSDASLLMESRQMRTG